MVRTFSFHQSKYSFHLSLLVTSILAAAWNSSCDAIFFFFSAALLGLFGKNIGNWKLCLHSFILSCYKMAHFASLLCFTSVFCNICFVNDCATKWYALFFLSTQVDWAVSCQFNFLQRNIYLWFIFNYCIELFIIWTLFPSFI